MALKNTYSKTPAENSIKEIEKALIKAGAIGIQYQYEQGMVSALRFVISIKGNAVGFNLPVQWQNFKEVLKRENIGRWQEDAYCYRVAWRCLADWVLAQLALWETQMVELPQVFLPFAVTKNGKTLYDQISDGRFLLGNGQ